MSHENNPLTFHYCLFNRNPYVTAYEIRFHPQKNPKERRYFSFLTSQRLLQPQLHLVGYGPRSTVTSRCCQKRPTPRGPAVPKTCRWFWGIWKNVEKTLGKMVNWNLVGGFSNGKTGGLGPGGLGSWDTLKWFETTMGKWLLFLSLPVFDWCLWCLCRQIPKESRPIPDRIGFWGLQSHLKSTWILRELKLVAGFKYVVVN